uniref:Uncharacterized protein n=1 Tax=Homo sapiens TaxID=9606 RepID=V9HVW5_HUMAN|nr:unknown [Homo sapiens]
MHFLCCLRVWQLNRHSPQTLTFFLIPCIGSPLCPTMSEAVVDTSSVITTKDFKEKLWRRQKVEETPMLTGTLMRKMGSRRLTTR